MKHAEGIFSPHRDKSWKKLETTKKKRVVLVLVPVKNEGEQTYRQDRDEGWEKGWKNKIKKKTKWKQVTGVKRERKRESLLKSE